MKETTRDRRVKYTVSVLKDALVLLLKDEHISKISVKGLCELADVNRSTFYAHFEDQYALLHYVEQEALENIKSYLERQDFVDKRPVSSQILARILEYVHENADLFKALLSENCEAGFQREIMSLSQVVSLNLNKKYDARVQEYVSVYAMTGCVSLLQKWLHDGMPESTAEIAEYIMQMLYSGMSSFE